MMMIMVMSITACGDSKSEEGTTETAASEEVVEPKEVVEPEEPAIVLVDQEIRGIGMSLTEDLNVEGSFGDQTEWLDTDNEEFGHSRATVTGPFAVTWTAAETTGEGTLTRESQHTTDPKLLEFDNTIKISDLETSYAHYTYVTNGITTEYFQYDIFHGDGTLTRVKFSFDPTKNSLLQENIDAVVATVAVK